MSDAREALRQSGAAAVMVGRAAVGRPWRVGEIAAALAGRAWLGPAGAAMAEAAVAHYDSLLTAFGVAQGLRHARKHVVAYLDEAARLGSPSAPALRAGLCNSDDTGAVTRGLVQAFHDIPERIAA